MMAAAFASGESHPTWWSYASPEATAIVGIQWENLRQSVFAEAVGAELSSLGSLGFPDLSCILSARQILISSPDLLAMAAGNFPPSEVQGQAAVKGMKRVQYRGIALYISPGRDSLSVAQIDEQLLLIGLRKTMESAIDRNQWTNGPIALRYSPLLTRAARAASGGDLWVVADELPDRLASLFVPLEIEADGFNGTLSVRNGLYLDAVIKAKSPTDATEIAESLKDSIPELPAVAKDLEVTVTGDRVMLGLDLNRDQLAASLRHAEPAPVASAPVPSAPPPAPLVAKPAAPPIAPSVAAAPIPAPPPAPAAAPEPPKSPEPQVIHIYGLDDGPREIVLPPEPRF
jgi:hypothetical protein